MACVLLIARPFSPNGWSLVNYIELIAYAAVISYVTLGVCVGKWPRASKVWILMAVMMATQGVVSALQAKIHFGQPITAGLVAERAKLLLPLFALGLVPLFHLARNNTRPNGGTHSATGQTVLIAAWITLLVDTYLGLSGRGQSGFEISSGGATLIGTKLKVLEFLPLAAGCITTSNFLSKPTLLGFSLVSFLVYYYTFIELSSTPQLLFMGSTVTLIAHSFYTGRFSKKLLLPFFATLALVAGAWGDWHSLWDTLFSGGSGFDISTNVRLNEYSHVAHEIRANWIFGVGKISERAMGGMTEQLGQWFFPGDLGAVGAIYVYGISALFPVCIQAYFFWQISEVARRNYNPSPMMIGLWVFALVNLLRVTLLGDAMFRPGALVLQWLIFQSLTSQLPARRRQANA